MSSVNPKSFFAYDDLYPTCYRTHATLCIYLPETYNPNELSGKLAINPSRTQVMGEVRNGKVKNWPTAWFLESTNNVDSKDVRRHIDWLLEQISGRSEIIQQLQAEGSNIHISCFWVSAVGHGGPMLDPDILKRIATLNIGITFDIYFEDEQEGESQ